MSQAKVDRYKEQKKNRQKIMKKEKREWMLTKAALGVFAAIVIAWAGVSVYQNVTYVPEDPTVEVQDYTVNTSALDEAVASFAE